MIPGGYVKPTFEVLYLVCFKALHQLLKYLHDGIFGVFAVLEVLEANAIDHRSITGKQMPQNPQIPGFFILLDQLAIIQA